MKKKNDIKMFGIIKKVFVATVSFFSCNTLTCVSMNNQECKIRPEIININSNEPCSVNINKCSGSFNNINDQYAKTMCSLCY